MALNKGVYKEIVQAHSRKSPIGKNCAYAFLFGGGFSIIGQLLLYAYGKLPVSAEIAALLTSVTLVFLGVFLTALGIYDRLAKVGGAGTLVPITGFANSVAAPIMEFRDEGYILGIGTKLFSIAGPVIAWGVIGSVIYGLLYFLYRAFF